MAYGLARDTYGWPSAGLRTDARTTNRPSAKTGGAGHHGIQGGIDPFVGPSLPAVAGPRKFARRYKSTLPGTRRQAGAPFADSKAQDFDSHAGKPAARAALGRKAPVRRLSEYAAHSERAVWPFRVWHHGGPSSSSTKLSGQVAFVPPLRPQPELSFWPCRADETPDADLAVSAANCGCPSKLNYINVFWKSPRMFDGKKPRKKSPKPLATA
jgi:hypothetical protein